MPQDRPEDLDPVHHERQAAAHLRAVEAADAYDAKAPHRLALASAHATLALSLRSRPEVRVATEPTDDDWGDGE